MWEINFKDNTIRFYDKERVAVEMFGFITQNNVGQVYFKNSKVTNIICDTDIDVFLFKCFSKARELGWNTDKEWGKSIGYVKNSLRNLQNKLK